MIFSASADLLNARGIIIPRALQKSADAEKITKNLATFRILSTLAKVVLAIPASAAKGEHVFSKGGL